MSLQQVSQSSEASKQAHIADLQRLAKKLHRGNAIASGVLWIITGLIALGFIAIIVKLLIDGVPYLINPRFYLANGADGTVGYQIFNTFYILILTQIILVPISLAAAIYLMEYSRQGPFVNAIHFAAETLAGVPSVVLGLFGAVFFVNILGLELSRLSGALTLLCLNFPITLRLFEDALASVPREQREGGLALGATRWHMIRTVVLPAALPGIITGIVLSAGKIIAEAAALIYTMGANNGTGSAITLDPFVQSDNLTIRIWYIQTVGSGAMKESVANAVSAGSSALLILILFVINFSARAIGRFIQRKVTAA